MVEEAKRTRKVKTGNGEEGAVAQMTQELATSQKLSKEQIVAAIESLSVLELAELVKALEERFGVTAAPVSVATPVSPSAGAPTAAPVEEQTEFDVILQSAGEKKIQVIKVVREITGLGLKEAKDLVDGAPKAVKEKVSKQEAEQIKKKLEAEGAVVEVK